MHILLWLQILVTVLHIIYGEGSNQNEKRYKRGICKPAFTICTNRKGSNPMWDLHGSVPNFFEIDVAPGCKNDVSFKVRWELRTKNRNALIKKFDRFNDQMTLTIDPGVLSPGEYILRAKVTESAPGKISGVQNVDCWIRSVFSNPLAIIKGGDEISAFFNESVTLDASNSFELANKNLVYNWECKTKIGTYNGCTSLKNKKEKIVQMNIEALEGNVYYIKLTVSSKNTNGANTSNSKTQKIVVVNSASPKIEIRCMKNCAEAGNAVANLLTPIYFRAFCIKNCEGNAYEWTVLKNKKPLQPNTSHFKFNTDKLYLNKGMGANDQIEITAIVRNGNNKKVITKRIFNTASDLQKVSKCQINKKPKWLLTDLKIRCQIRGKPPLIYYLKHITNIDGRKIESILGFGSVPQMIAKIAIDEKDKIGAQTLYVQAEDSSRSYSSLLIKVNVDPVLEKSNGVSAMQKITDIYDGKTDYVSSVKSLMKYGKSGKVLQVLQALLSEQKTIPNNELIIKLKSNLVIKIMEDLRDHFILNTFEIVAIATFIPQLVVLPNATMEYKYARVKSELCRKISEALARMVENDRYPYTYYHHMVNIKSCLDNCAASIIDQKFEKPQGFDIKNPVSMNIHPTSEEDYPNYKDSLPDFVTADFRATALNALETLKNAANAFVRTVAPGEPDIPQSNLVSVNSDYSKFISQKTYKSTNASVVLPKSLGLPHEDEVRVVFTSFSKTGFTEKLNEHIIQTNVIALDIFTKTGPIRSVKFPLDYIFKVHATNHTKIYSGEVTAPTNEKDWVSKVIDFNMTVIRIEVSHGTTFFAKFNNISPVSELLVVNTKFRRPRFADFKNATIVKNEDSVHFPAIQEDCWYYIAILPKKEDALKKGIDLKREEREAEELLLRFGDDYSLHMNSAEQNGLTVTFDYTMTSQACMEWRKNEWVPADCEILNAGIGKIHCRCKVVSTMAGQELALEHKRDDIKTIKFYITLKLNYVIYAATSIVIALYCIAMCFSVLRKQSKRNLYFLSDNLKDERYAYFITIITNFWVGSGTTSNVTIKLHGTKGESKAHVLNYPDPDKEILQQANEDWFVLTTKIHLGLITHIQLWYDCIGHRTNWFCNNVHVYDLQTEKSWHFTVNKKFTVLKQDRYHIVVNSTENLDSTKNMQMIKRFLILIRFSFGANHTWNIFTGSDDLNFSYTERISVLLSRILCVYAFGLILCCGPSVRIQDGLAHNYFHSYIYIIIYSTITAMFTFTINTPYVILFRNMRRASHVYHFRRMYKIFPPGVKYIAWILLIGTILIAVIYLIVCSFWISHISSLVWLTVTTLALIIDIFILENLYIALCSFFLTYLPNKYKTSMSYNFKTIVNETEKQRRMLFSKLGIYGLRPYLTHLYKPLSYQSFIEKRRKERTKQALAQSFKDIVSFILYLSLLYTLLYVNMEDMSTVNTEHVKDMVQHGRFAPFGGIEEVHDTETLYKYLNETFIPTLHPMNWYGNWNISDPGLMADFSTKVLGVARIRQQRVRKNSCILTKFMKDLNISNCNPEYSSSQASIMNINKDTTKWSFQENKDTRLPVVFGHAQTYSGNGFMSKLGRTINNAYFMLATLRNDRWIDELSRAIFVEFWMYNANVNLFSAVIITFERSATQYMMKEVEVFTGRLCYPDSSTRLLTIPIFICFILIITRQIYRYIETLIITRLKYLKKLINLVETSIHILNILVIYLILMKEQMLTDLLRKLETNKQTEFIPYFRVIMFYDAINILTAILIAIAVIRLWNFLRFILVLRIFERTLVASFRALVGVSIACVIILLMFGLSGYIMFNSFLGDFRSITQSFVTLFRIICEFKGDLDYDLLFDYYCHLGMYHSALFDVLAIVLLNLYAVVIIIYYEESRRHYSNIQLGCTVKDYIIGEWQYITELFKRRLLSLRLRGGQDCPIPGNLKVNPKTDAFRYADCVLMSNKKLDTMSLIARSVIRKLHSKEIPHIYKDDMDLMNRIALNKIDIRTGGDAEQIFLRGKTDTGHVKFISDIKLLQMEYIVTSLLSDKEKAVNLEEETITINDHKSLYRIKRIEAALFKVSQIINNIDVVLVRKQKHYKRA